MAELTRQGRYDRMTDTLRELTGEDPMTMRDFVTLHATEFEERRGGTGEVLTERAAVVLR